MADDIKEIEKKLNRLKASLDQVGQKSLERIIAALKSGGAGLDEWNDQLSTFQDKADKVSSSLGYVAQSFKDSVNELSRQNKYLTSSQSIISKISNTARETLSIRRGESSLDKKSVEKAREKINIQREELKQAKDLGGLTQAQQKEIQSVIDSLNDYEKGLEGVLQTHEDINKQLGFSPKLAAGLDKALGKLGIPKLGISDALDKTHKLGQEAASLKENFNASSTFTKQLGGNLSSAVTKANVLQAVVGFMVEAILESDKAAGDMAKGLNISYQQALSTRQELSQIANYSNDSAINTNRLSETLSVVNSEMGTSAKLSEEELVTMTKLNKQSGISLEIQTKLRSLAVATGQTYKNFVVSFQASAKSAAFQSGIALNTKKLMTDIANVSSRTKLSIEGGATGLAKAAVAAKVMGSDLEKVANIADQLLNFEQSIEAELSAELLLGKNINLEKARNAALNNDLATVAEEITKQAGSAAEFSKMNRIQQEAMAKAVGMTADQLADTLVEQEALKSLNKELDEDEKKAFEAAKAKYGVEEASKMLKEGQLEQLVDQQNIQEKFTESVEKMKEIFVTMAPAILSIGEALTSVLNIVSYIMPVIQGIFDIFKYIYGFVDKIVQGITKMFPALKPVVKILKGLASIGVIYAAYMAYSSLAAIPYIGVALGAAAAAGVTAAGLGALSAIKADDMVSEAPGGGYGKRTLLGPEGAIQLNDKDTVIAGTNLFGNDVASEPGKATQMGGKGEIKLGGDSSAVVNAIMELRKDVNALANRPISVAIDGKKVIEATTGAQPNTQGDENRKNSYKMS